MLKLVKWAYSLGVRQERIRISAHLQNVSRQAEFSHMDMFDKMENARTSKTVRQRLDFDMAVEKKIKDIVNDILLPQSSDYFGYSVMFPDDKHKGEM